ncbi:unnamed protein product [Rotaria sp. Silwood2]|nr:unnamed protein product [Rotaria sp. Silwood2]CAF4196005.1 unnamed protein product [Rotaria sp. Silwood2]
MFAVKRRLSNIESSEEEKKKFRTTHDDKKLINRFENLSNELFYEIFDYLDGCDIHKIFSSLNSRFEALLNCSSLQLKIDLRFHPEPILQYYSTCVVASKKDRIISLRWPNLDDYNSGFTLFNIDSSFAQLESLVLGNIESNQLIHLLINLISLPRLFSLTINYDDDLLEINNIYQIIFNLPMLKYYKLSFFSLESLFPTSISIKEQYSDIKYLVIDHCCSLDMLIAILSCTPQLYRLTCKQVNESVDNIITNALNAIFSLTRISIGSCYAEFDEIELFLINISPQLQVLRISTFRDVTYLDANRWEQIISQHLLHLNVFDFKYEQPIDEDFQASVYHERLNQFNSQFWMKREWFFRIYIDTNFWNDNVIVCSIFPYRPIRGNSHEEKENDESFNENINQNIIQRSVIPSQEEFVAFSKILSETYQLTVIDLLYSEFDETFFDIIRPILTTVKITCLNIILNKIFIGTLIDLIKCLPNLDSLVISSLTMIQPRCLSVEEARTFRFLSNNNKITKVNLKQMNDLEQVQFLVDLCSQMKYFEVNCTNDVGLEKVLRFILMKNTKYMPNLSLLCLQISETSMDIVDKLKNIINFEQLCHNYAIKQIDKRIYLQLSS